MFYNIINKNNGLVSLNGLFRSGNLHY